MYKGLAELCFNCLWGFFGQQKNKVQTRVTNDSAELHVFLMCSIKEVTGILPVNVDILYGSSRFKEGCIVPLNTAYIFIADSVTAQGQFKLYGYLKKLGKSAIFCDMVIVPFETCKNLGNIRLTYGIFTRKSYQRIAGIQHKRLFNVVCLW